MADQLRVALNPQTHWDKIYSTRIIAGEVLCVNKTHFQMLADMRIEEAMVLLADGKWSGAYYLSGYAVECALKACILAKEYAKGLIFREKNFSKDCWTHDLVTLVGLAELKTEHGMEMAGNVDFYNYWNVVKDWKEDSRYHIKTQADADAIVLAVSQGTNGVLPWAKKHW